MNARLAVLVAAPVLALSLSATAAEAAPASKPLAPVQNALAGGDPLAFDPAQLAELERKAAFGHSRPLYVKSPGGVIDTARRTARWRPLIERAVAGSGFSADTVEAIILLESAGRHDAIAGNGAMAASGLVQIMGYTANDFLGMNVNLQASAALTKQIAAARKKGNRAAVRRLEARRRQVDSRFDPPQALAAAVRYLTTAHGYLGRNDLAVASYHMGIGNLQNALRAYGNTDVPYAQLFFDSGPDRNAAAWNTLLELSDDSRHYYFKVLAARQIMHLYRSDRSRLASLATLHARKHSHEEVMHPSWSTKVFTGPREIAVARSAGELLPLPNQPGRLHFELSQGMGSLAPPMGVKKDVYRALRPEALAALTYLAQRVQQVGKTDAPLTITSSVRDWKYQSRLMRTNSMAARNYSIHTTGYAFDIARIWTSESQAAAVQFVLDRLVAHGLVAYIKEPHAIHVAVSRDARVLIPAMLGGAPEARSAAAAAAPKPVAPAPPAPATDAEADAEAAAAAVATPVPHVGERGTLHARAHLLEPFEPNRPAQSAHAAPRDTPVVAAPGFFAQLRDALGIWTPAS